MVRLRHRAIEMAADSILHTICVSMDYKTAQMKCEIDCFCGTELPTPPATTTPDNNNNMIRHRTVEHQFSLFYCRTLNAAGRPLPPPSPQYTERELINCGALDLNGRTHSTKHIFKINETLHNVLWFHTVNTLADRRWISIYHFQYRNYGAFFRSQHQLKASRTRRTSICVYVSVAQLGDRCGGGLNAAKYRNQICSLFLISLCTFYFLQTLSTQCAEHHLGRTIAAGHFVIVIITSTENVLAAVDEK